MAQSIDNFDIFSKEKRFDVLDEATKDNQLQSRKAVNTNIATKQWVLCLNQY